MKIKNKVMSVLLGLLLLTPSVQAASYPPDKVVLVLEYSGNLKKRTLLRHYKTTSLKALATFPEKELLYMDALIKRLERHFNAQVVLDNVIMLQGRPIFVEYASKRYPVSFQVRIPTGQVCLFQDEYEFKCWKNKDILKGNL